jgi:hypothetical protein
MADGTAPAGAFDLGQVFGSQDPSTSTLERSPGQRRPGGLSAAFRARRAPPGPPGDGPPAVAKPGRPDRLSASLKDDKQRRAARERGQTPGPRPAFSGRESGVFS